jgi:hypothetical protein
MEWWEQSKEDLGYGDAKAEWAGCRICGSIVNAIIAFTGYVVVFPIDAEVDESGEQ